MNFLTRLLSAQLIRSSLSSSQPAKCILLIQALAAVQHASFSSSSTARTRITKPKEPSSPTASYVLNPPKLAAKEAGSASSWRRPSEIPFQGKAANSVKVIGFVQYPVQFQTLPDGKCVAATVIMQDNNELETSFSAGSMSNVTSLLIPVVFEGDLAHVVKCHVNESDCVYVSGQLSGERLPFVIGQYEGNFHIVAQDVYFVQGVEGKKTRAIISDSKNLAECGNQRPNLDSKNQDTASEDISVKEMKNGGSIVSDDSSMPRNGGVCEDWLDLIRNPNEWWDYRGIKSEGRVKAGHPDFKHRTKSAGLWLNKAPKWAIKGIEGVKFGSKEFKRGKDEQWKSLVENPDKWWDNRSRKTNEKAPDFKNKESGEALWLNSAPEWAVSMLPPLTDRKHSSAAT